MKAYWGEEAWLHAFVSSIPDEVCGQAHVSAPIPMEDPRAGLDAVEKRKFCVCASIEPRLTGRPACSLFTVTYWLICPRPLLRIGNQVPISWAEPFLRSCQLCSHSRTCQRFMEPEGSLPRSQEPSTGPYPEPDRSNPYHCVKDG
jgi:hypothetical protein